MLITRKRYFNPLTFFGCNALKFVSINNKECKVRTEIRNINSNEPSFCPHSILANKCCSSYNNINDPCTKSCVSDIIEDMNIKVYNLMSRTNETRHISWYETSTCKCRLDASTFNDKCRWEC